MFLLTAFIIFRGLDILSHPLFKEEILANRSGNVVGVGPIEEDYGGRGAVIASSIFAGMLIGGM